MLDYQEYKKQADIFSRKLAPVSNRVDVTGQDRDDYRSIFWTKVCSIKDVSDDNPRAWINRAVNNQMLDCFKKMTTDSAQLATRQEMDNSFIDYGFESRIIARELIGVVHKRLSKNEWQLLTNYVEQDGNVTHIWRDSDRDYSRRGLSDRVWRLLVKCRRILENQK